MTHSMTESLSAFDWFSNPEYNLFDSMGEHLGASDSMSDALIMAESAGLYVVTFTEEGWPVLISRCKP